jgi:hypothetical protein
MAGCWLKHFSIRACIREEIFSILRGTVRDTQSSRSLREPSNFQREKGHRIEHKFAGAASVSNHPDPKFINHRAVSIQCPFLYQLLSHMPSILPYLPPSQVLTLCSRSSHHSARNRQTTAFIPITLNTLRLSRRTTIALDNRADGRGGSGAGTVAVYEGVGWGAHFDLGKEMWSQYHPRVFLGQGRARWRKATAEEIRDILFGFLEGFRLVQNGSWVAGFGVLGIELKEWLIWRNDVSHVLKYAEAARFHPRIWFNNCQKPKITKLTNSWTSCNESVCMNEEEKARESDFMLWSLAGVLVAWILEAWKGALIGWVWWELRKQVWRCSEEI